MGEEGRKRKNGDGEERRGGCLSFAVGRIKESRRLWFAVINYGVGGLDARCDKLTCGRRRSCAYTEQH